jgi:Zn-dependent protease with chaperone function
LVLATLIEASNGSDYLPKEPKVRVVHIPTIGCFFTLNGTLYVSAKLLSICETEDELALVIGHELCHYLMGHMSWKYFSLIIN